MKISESKGNRGSCEKGGRTLTVLFAHLILKADEDRSLVKIEIKVSLFLNEQEICCATKISSLKYLEKSLSKASLRFNSWCSA